MATPAPLAPEPPASSAAAGMHGLIAAYPWHTTPLGAEERWPPHLRCAVDLMLAHGFPMIVLWGEELIQIYNDGYAEIMRDKHPHGLGRSNQACWPEVWHINGPIYRRVMTTGDTVTFEDKHYPLARGGADDGAWFTITYSPLRSDTGDICGVLVTMFETTAGHRERAQRLIAEADLRANEARFRQFATASSDVLWIRNADTLAMEYLSPAFERVYGTSREQVMHAPEHWAALVIPDDRPAALQRTQQVRDGQPVVHDIRILRESDRTFRWIRSTEFPLLDEAGRVQRIAGISADVTEIRHLLMHQEVLLAELQHRVRNIMAMIASVARRSRHGAASVQAYADSLIGRLMSLARTQALLTRAANVGIDLATMLGEELGAQADTAGQYVLEGPAVTVPPKAAEVLSLAVHELTTNALKYGALSERGGTIAIRWTLEQRDDTRWLSLHWQERCPPSLQPLDPSAQRRSGFGTALVEERVPYELRGSGRIVVTPGGIEATIAFPLLVQPSILETDAPVRAGVRGGALDLGATVDLHGQRILLLDDDYYLANDSANVLRMAGAQISGPFATQASALAAVEAQPPTFAILDINLGDGPGFATADALMARAIPFVFLTGYDASVIPERFGSVTRLQKPVELRRLVEIAGGAS